MCGVLWYSGVMRKNRRKHIPRVPDLSRYSGQWVALIGTRPVAHGRTLPALLERVKAKKPREQPAVFLVPRKNEGPYILLG